MSITVEIANYDDVVRKMKGCQKDLAKGVKRALDDMAKREVHTVVKREVSKVYNIAQKNVKGSPGRTNPYYDEVGSITLAGVKIPFYEVKYKGRGLTPIHFGMHPDSRPAGKKGYNVTWKPLKAGGKIPLVPAPKRGASPTFLAAPRGQSLPWVRLGHNRMPIDVVRTHLSVPQMVDNEKVQPHIQKEVEQRIEMKLNALLG